MGKPVRRWSQAWAKVTGIAWQGDGFYYSGYDAPDSAKALTSKNEGHKVYYHRVGTTQSPSDLVYEDKANPERFHTVSTTEDERYAILKISDREEGPCFEEQVSQWFADGRVDRHTPCRVGADGAPGRRSMTICRC